MLTSRFQGLRRPIPLNPRLRVPVVIPPEIQRACDAFSVRAAERFDLIDAWPPRLRRMYNIMPRAIFPASDIDQRFRGFLEDFEGDVDEAVAQTIVSMKRSFARRKAIETLPEKTHSF